MRIIYKICNFVKRNLIHHKNDVRVKPNNLNRRLQIGAAIAVIVSIFIIAGSHHLEHKPTSTLHLLSDTGGNIEELLISGGCWACAGDYLLPYLKQKVKFTVVDTGRFPLQIDDYKLHLDLKRLGDNDWETWIQDPFVVLTSLEGRELEFVVSRKWIETDKNCLLAVQELARRTGAEAYVSSLIFDGGNVVSNNRYFFICQSTIDENCSSNFKSEKIIRYFEELFGKKAVVIDNSDCPQILFHVDMFLTPVGEDTIVVGDTRWAADIIEKNLTKTLEYEIGIELNAYFSKFNYAFRNIQRINHRDITWKVRKKRSGNLEKAFLCASPLAGCLDDSAPECWGKGIVADQYVGQKLIAQIIQEYAPILKTSRKTLGWIDVNGNFQIDFLQGHPLYRQLPYQIIAARDVIPFEICWENSQGKRGAIVYSAGIAAKNLLRMSIGKNRALLADCLDNIARALTAQGYKVKRIPLFVTIPNMQGVKEGMHFPHGKPFWITYNNVLLNGDTVLLPVYGAKELDRAAISVWKDELGFDVVPVHGLTFLNSLEGSLRCATKVIRRN